MSPTDDLSQVTERLWRTGEVSRFDFGAIVPATVGRYEVGVLLGSGGMAEVYRAFDPTLTYSGALKLIEAQYVAHRGGDVSNAADADALFTAANLYRLRDDVRRALARSA